MEKIDLMMESEDATWRDILMSVLEDMNPWDIDLVELATRYSRKVDEMTHMSFRLPANVVLVCSVLLRMKADILAPKEEEFNDVSASLNFIFNGDYPIAALLNSEGEPYPISIKPARALTRKVSANELIAAIQDALSERTKMIERAQMKAARKALDAEEAPAEIYLEPQINILEAIEHTYARVMDILSSKEVALFSEMVKTKEDVVRVFLSLLHLSNTQKIALNQEQLFGEIYIKSLG
ncbi:MAG: segregation/condensation protein A [Candidatus Altiarchaeota archaeon]|nr:segregation/condensation protein A [Candidatus Altiarchaeota archaeon]